MEIKIDLNEPKILEKVTSDKFGLFVSNEWKRIIDPFTPRETGMLMKNTRLGAFEIEYKEPYASAVYYNRRGVTFIRNGTNRNPYATQEWDKAAASSGQLDKLYRILNKGLQSGRF